MDRNLQKKNPHENLTTKVEPMNYFTSMQKVNNNVISGLQ